MKDYKKTAELIEIITSIIRDMCPYESITQDTELMDSGILNSLSVIALITQLEDDLDVQIPDDSVTVANFSTVLSIVRLIEKINN